MRLREDDLQEGAWQARHEEESSSRDAVGGKVQAMQLKLFIETSFLQKREKPRYKAAAREACGENTRERNQKRAAQEKATKGGSEFRGQG